MSSEVRKGDYSLVTDGGTTRVYRNGQLLGHFWDDPQSGGYAAFHHGTAKPIARPKSQRGCVLKLTNNAWDGQP